MKASDLVRTVAIAHKEQLEQLVGRTLADGEADTLVASVVQAFFDGLGATLAAGSSVVLRRFGKFETRHLQARVMRPGGLRAAVAVPARTSVGFTPSAALKTLVRSKEHEGGDVQQHEPSDEEG